MLAWRGWKNQRRQLVFHKSGRGKKGGQRDEKAEKCEARPGCGLRQRMEAEEGQKCSNFLSPAQLRFGKTETCGSHRQEFLGSFKPPPAPPSTPSSSCLAPSRLSTGYF